MHECVGTWLLPLLMLLYAMPLMSEKLLVRAKDCCNFNVYDIAKRINKDVEKQAGRLVLCSCFQEIHIALMLNLAGLCFIAWYTFTHFSWHHQHCCFFCALVRMPRNFD